MGDEWREARLGQLGEVNRGRSRHRPRDAAHLYGGAYPFIQTGDIKASGGRVTSHSQTYSEAGLAQSRLWPEGTMVITIAANIAETAILTYPACFPDSVVGFIADKQRADVRFVEYLFRHLRRQIQHENVGTGSVQDNINLQTLARLTLRVPEPHEQRRIAHILGTLDDKIENNRKTAKTLEAMAQAIFKSWFVDFDPVRAKMAGEPPESICKRLKLTPEILDLFPDRLVDSELGEIPEGWGNVPFSECVTIIGGGTPKTSVLEYWGGNIPWFSIVDAPIGDGIWVVDTEKKISESGLNNSSTRILPIGTTIITARGTVGRVAIVGVPMAMNQSCYGLRGKYDELGFFTHFCTRLIINELRQHAHGSVFDTITRDTLESIEVTLPPTGIIDWFERTISLPMKRLKQYSEETHIVTMLRDTLLPKLISGEIRVPDVDSIVCGSIRELHRDDLSKGTE